MIDSTGQIADHLCQACFTGEYPIPLPEASQLGKHLLEQSISTQTLPILNNP
jgi:amidophosphoribosyltransferase